MRVTVSNACALEGVPPALAREIRGALTVENPARIAAVRYGKRRTFLPKFLTYYQTDQDGTLQIPRGFGRQLLQLAEAHFEPVEIRDETRALPEVAFSFLGQLKPFQERAVEDILRRSCGVLSSPTGSGKTVMALALIAHRRQPALVLVHRLELAAQWRDAAQRFLGLDPSEVGMIGDGRFSIGKRLTIGMAQSLDSRAHEVVPRIGHLVIDEAHHVPARLFSEIAGQFDCRFVTGLSATAFRRDGLDPLILWFIGPVVHKIQAGDLQAAGDLVPFEVSWRSTGFRSSIDPKTGYSRLLNALTEDEGRNLQVAADVTREALAGPGVCLCLSDRKAHCQVLHALVSEVRGIRAAVLTGDTPRHERWEIIERAGHGDLNVLIATAALIGEGFDCARLDALVLACPMKFRGRLLQALGRIVRPTEGKSIARVIDYEDPVHVLRSAARERRKLYDTAAVQQQAA